MEFNAKMFDGKSTEQLSATVSVNTQFQTLTVKSSNGIQTFKFSEIEFVHPTGRDTGSLFCDRTTELRIPDTATHKSLKKLLGSRSIFRRLDDIRDSWPIVVVALLILTVSVIAFIAWGFPALAKKIAENLPDEVAETIGEQGLQQMRSSSLHVSQLPSDQQRALETRFEELIAANGLNREDFNLHFFSSEDFGPNAFALPSGDIVVLDELTKIQLTEDEITAILAHEIAHVTKKHSLQSLIRMAGITASIAIATGDITSGSSLALLIPRFLIEKGYSREFEREADAMAVTYLFQIGTHPENLISALEKITNSVENAPEIPNFISTHPSLKNRTELIRKEIESVAMYAS